MTYISQKSKNNGFILKIKKEKILDFESQKNDSKAQDGEKKCVVLQFHKKNSFKNNIKLDDFPPKTHHRSLSKKETICFQKNVRNLQADISEICTSLDKRIDTIRGDYNYKLYISTARDEIREKYPQYQNLSVSPHDSLIVEVIRMIWGWLLQCCINPEDIEKCKDALSAFISAHKLSDMQISLLEKFYAANTAMDLMDKYFPFTKQMIR